MTFIGRLFGRTGAGWAAFIVLAPVAYLAGAFLISRYEASSRLEIAIDRDQATAIAHDYARSLGVETKGWRSYVAFQPDPAWRRYLASHPDESLQRLRETVPALVGRSLLVAPDGSNESFEVRLTRTGRVVGYQRLLPKRAGEVTLSGSAAEALARRAMAEHVGSAAAGSYELIGSASQGELDAIQKVYTFRRSLDGFSDVALETVIALQGDEVVRRTTGAAVAPSFTGGVAHLDTAAMLTKGLLIVLVVLSVSIYTLVRLILRAREKEVPWKRVILLGVAFGAVVAINMALSDATRFPLQTPGHEGHGHANTTGSQVLIGAILAALGMGTLIGLAWGASEGDVRELYPDKLSSFDALLGGALQSAAVWRSLALGLAFGGYGILALGLFQWFLSLHANAYQVVQFEYPAILTSRSPLLLGLLMFLSAVALLMVAVLVPLSICRRWVRRARLPLMVFLLLFAFFVLGTAGNYVPIYAGLAVAAISAGLMLVPFWKGDLLAAVGATIGSGAVTLATHLGSQPAASLQRAALQLVLVLIALAVVATIGSWRGREVAFDALRPEYARNITERLALQTDIDAARQAQLRVMPRRAPAVEGLDIAALCRPARHLSGDFYDFLRVGPRQVDIALAAGERLRLSSALAVTLAKGMLLAYSKRGVGPGETLRHVHRHMTSIFGDGLPFSLLYATLDTARGTIDYATLGPSVGIVMSSGEGQAQWLRAVTDVKEAVVTGSVTIRAGDRILLTTRGLVHATNDVNERFGPERLSALVGTAPSGAEAALESTFAGVAAHARDTDAEDDWTAVTVVVTEVSDPAIEKEMA